MTITTANIAKQLRPGLDTVLGLGYKAIQEYHKDLFDIRNSEKAYEEMVMMSGLGLAPVKAEGAAVQFDDMQETYTARVNHETIALGFAVTEEATEDNLYESASMMKASALGRSLAVTKQQKAAALFNNGFNSTFAIGDGAAFFSASHGTINGNQSNLLTAADLSETALESALIDISLAKDERGMLVAARALSLHIAPAAQFQAAKILGSQLSTTLATNSTTGVTNVNDINVISQNSLVPQGYKVNPYFTDADAWFIKTDIPNSAVMFTRSPVKMSDEGDFSTGNYRYKARERYSFMVGDWRGYFGNAGA
jgi:hypothetical protein